MTSVNIDIGPEWVTRSEEQGQRIVDSYQHGFSPRSKACVVAGRNPIHDKPDIQAFGRRAEVAVCKYLDLDPAHYLNWSNYAESDGIDIAIEVLKLDVKGSPHPKAQYLIWPESKRKFFDALDLNILAFVRALYGPDDLVLQGSKNWLTFMGWTTKEEFSGRLLVADGTHPRGLVKNTWYMPQEELWPPAALRGVIHLYPRKAA